MLGIALAPVWNFIALLISANAPNFENLLAVRLLLMHARGDRVLFLLAEFAGSASFA